MATARKNDRNPPTPSRAKSLEELAAQQGIKPVENVDEFIGQGADFWVSDAEFDQFIDWWREIRREGR